MKVFMNGVAGRMGQAITAGIIDKKDIEIVGAADFSHSCDDISEIIGGPSRGIRVYNTLDEGLKAVNADVVVDFTIPGAVYSNMETAIKHKVDMVIGTTGINEADLPTLDEQAKAAGIRLFIVPNFAIGAVLMMRFAAEAVKYFPDSEIIEMHHNQKLDAPSGTAVKTMQMMTANREPHKQGKEGEKETIPGSRGGDIEGMRVHSVRLPGYVASQEVIFGGLGQIMTIRHDSLNRDSYVPGVLLALRNVDKLEDGVAYGLDVVM